MALKINPCSAANTVVNTCDQVLGQLGTNSAGTTKLDPKQLVPVVHAALEGGTVGGLITGGGN